MHHSCLLVLALVVVSTNCYGSLLVTYNSATCGGANNDPTSVSYSEVNSKDCAGVGTKNCTTASIFGRPSSTVQTCEASDASTKNYLPATSLYYGAQQFKDATCGNTSTPGFSTLHSTDFTATTGGYVCYVGDSSNPSIRQQCAKDGTMTLFSCTSTSCAVSSCTAMDSTQGKCNVNRFGSVKLTCTACPTCTNNAITGTLSIFVLAFVALVQFF